MKRIISDNNASAYPVMIFFIILAMVSLLVLLFGHLLEPVVNIMGLHDDSVKSSITQPRDYFRDFVKSFWPMGMLVVIFFGLSFALVMDYQKNKYKGG